MINHQQHGTMLGCRQVRRLVEELAVKYASSVQLILELWQDMGTGVVSPMQDTRSEA